MRATRRNSLQVDMSKHKKRLRDIDAAIEKENDIFLMDADDPETMRVRLDAYDRMVGLEAERERVAKYEADEMDVKVNRIMNMDFPDPSDEKYGDHVAKLRDNMHPMKPPPPPMTEDERYRHAERAAEARTAHVGAPAEDDESPVSTKKQKRNNAILDDPILKKGKDVLTKVNQAKEGLKFAHGTYETFRDAQDKENAAAKNAERKFFDDNKLLDIENRGNMTPADRARLRRAVRSARYDTQIKDASGIFKSLPFGAGGIVGDVTEIAMRGLGAIKEAGENAKDDGDDAARTAIAHLTKIVGADEVLGQNWRGRSKGRPTSIIHTKSKDMTDIWANGFEYATSDMDDDWLELPYGWSTIDTSKMKTESQMLEFYQRNNDYQYQVYLNRAQLETGDKPKGEWDSWYLRAKEEGLVGKQTPYAIEQLYADDFKKQTAVDATDEAVNSQRRVNGQDALPGSAVYDYGDDRYYYGDRNFRVDSKPVYQPQKHPRQEGLLESRLRRDKFDDDGLESRPMAHLNSKNTSLTVNQREIRDRRTSRMLPETRMPPPEAFRARGYEPPKAQIYSSAGAARYVNPTPYRELDADAQSHVSYDPSNNVSMAAAAVPSGKQTEVAKVDPSSLSETPFLVGIGSDEHTGKIRIGTEINNDDYGATSDGSTDQPQKTPTENINAANEKNPQAPIVQREDPKVQPKKVAFPGQDKINFVRGPSAVM